MARIPVEVVERLKTEMSVQRLAEARGVVLKKHGNDLIGRCPFHDDKTPSLVVTPANNLWHCLGACQAGGTVIDWVIKAEGVSFRHAVELLQNDYDPLAAASGAPPAKHSTVKKLSMPIAADAEDAKLLAQVIEYYPNFHPPVMVRNKCGELEGQPAPTAVLLGHELGHALRYPYNEGPSPDRRDNVNEFENPIRAELGLPPRVNYPVPFAYDFGR